MKEPIRRDNVTFFFNGATLNFPDTTPSEIPAGYVIHLPVPWQTIHPDKNEPPRLFRRLRYVSPATATGAF